MEWHELIEFIDKQLLIFIVFVCGLIVGYMYGFKDGAS